MKKIFGALLICLSLVVFVKPSMAGTCNGGVEFQGAENGHTYCRSSTGMTWWAAIAWCKKQGRELGSMDQLCDRKNGANDTSCPNMKINIDFQGWSSNPNDSAMVFTVHLKSGMQFENYRNVTHLSAICY